MEADMKKVNKASDGVPQYKLSDAAIEWIVENGIPFFTHDFAGYSIAVDDKNGCAVGLDGSFYPFSLDLKHPTMGRRRVGKIIKTFLKTGFLRDSSTDPFPEMELYNNIPFNCADAIPMNTFFMNPSQSDYEAGFQPDDDFQVEGFVDFLDKVMDNIDKNIETTQVVETEKEK